MKKLTKIFFALALLACAPVFLFACEKKETNTVETYSVVYVGEFGDNLDIKDFSFVYGDVVSLTKDDFRVSGILKDGTTFYKSPDSVKLYKGKKVLNEKGFVSTSKNPLDAGAYKLALSLKYQGSTLSASFNVNLKKKMLEDFHEILFDLNEAPEAFDFEYSGEQISIIEEIKTIYSVDLALLKERGFVSSYVAEAGSPLAVTDVDFDGNSAKEYQLLITLNKNYYASIYDEEYSQIAVKWKISPKVLAAPLSNMEDMPFHSIITYDATEHDILSVLDLFDDELMEVIENENSDFTFATSATEIGDYSFSLITKSRNYIFEDSNGLLRRQVNYTWSIEAP